MSLRFRKSMKLMPGVRLNFNKDSVGMSFGVPGARYTINSKGRRTVSTGIPGTGLYNVETLSSGRKKTAPAQQSTSAEETFVPYDPPKSMQPGLFAFKAERALYAYLRDIFQWNEQDTPDQAIEKAKVLREKHPTLKWPLFLIQMLYSVKGSSVDDSVAYEWTKELWANRATAFNDGYVEKYFKGLTLQVQVTPGISTNQLYDAQTLGHIIVELLQQMGKHEEAIAILNEMLPDQLVGISLADIEISSKDFDGAIETTEDIDNEDDATAMMLILRGIAFREKGMEEASLECFKRALASKKRSETMLHRAHFERAETYARMGKKAMAIKDLEKILVDDSDYPAVQEKLDQLNA
jgi:tetratricopeptide (TPR) repeat protein